MTATSVSPVAISVAITGASGSLYGLRLVQCLLEAQRPVDLLITSAGRLVLEQECDLLLPESPQDARRILQDRWPEVSAGLQLYGMGDWHAPMASGSARGRAMVVCPCSMGTLAAIANGMSDNLLERAADVAIKERFPLILVVRETPLSVIHLNNMLRLAQMGVTILPAAPGFYHRPQSVQGMVDFIVARVLDQLGIAHTLVAPWCGGTGGGKMKGVHQPEGDG